MHECCMHTRSAHPGHDARMLQYRVILCFSLFWGVRDTSELLALIWHCIDFHVAMHYRAVRIQPYQWQVRVRESGDSAYHAQGLLQLLRVCGGTVQALSRVAVVHN